jgi:uncharacterized membrane protein YkoI
MTRKLLVGAIAAGALIVTTGTAFALTSDDGTTTPTAQVTTPTTEDSTSSTPTSDPTSVPTSDPTSTSTDTSTPTAVPPGSLTADDASRIATDRFGGTVREVELEFEHGRTEWKVEVTAADGVTYDVRVDATTGAITSVGQDDRRGGADDPGFDDHGGDNHGGDDRGGDDHGGHDRGGDDHGGGRHGGDDH